MFSKQVVIGLLLSSASSFQMLKDIENKVKHTYSAIKHDVIHDINKSKAQGICSSISRAS